MRYFFMWVINFFKLEIKKHSMSKEHTYNVGNRSFKFWYPTLTTNIAAFFAKWSYSIEHFGNAIETSTQELVNETRSLKFTIFWMSCYLAILSSIAMSLTNFFRFYRVSWARLTMLHNMSYIFPETNNYIMLNI